MIISHSRQFVFIHVHKTAGESITRALAPHLARRDLVLGSTALGELRNVHYKRRYRLTKHSTAAAVKAFVGAEIWNSYFKFAVVRHPCDRMLSLYSYYAKIAARRQSDSPKNLLYSVPLLASRDPLLWPGMSAYLATGSFSEFIRHADFKADIATRSQSATISDESGAIAMDFVGRQEDLDADFATIADRLGLSAIRLGTHNTSRDHRPAVHLSHEDRALLEEMYADDFERLGYPT